MPKWSQKRKASHPTKYGAPRRMSPESKAKHRRLASHVEAASNMAQLREEGFNFEALDDIENLRCCCANCNGDMRQHNMFSFLDIVGRFMEDEYARWRQWRASL